MPAPILVDTAFVIALINQRDQYHEQAVQLACEFEEHPLLITDAVLLEIGNALARGYRKEACQIIEEFLDSEEVQVISLTPQLFAQALALYKKHHDKEWSLVDCVSFAVMRQMGIGSVLTFDHHFAQAGFALAHL